MRIAAPLTGAYLAVAYADGRYDRPEERRFLAGVANHPALSTCSTAALEAAYNALTADFERDYAAACAAVIDSITAIRDDETAAEAVQVAARAAIVADHVLTAQEELVLNRIAEALGLQPGDV